MNSETLSRTVCNEAIARGLVEPNDAIEYTYAKARLKEMRGGGTLKSKMPQTTRSCAL